MRERPVICARRSCNFLYLHEELHKIRKTRYFENNALCVFEKYFVIFQVRPLKIDVSFRCPPPIFFYVSKKKLRGFPKLRGFQKSVKGFQKYTVFTLKVEGFSWNAKICWHTKLRGILKKWNQCPKRLKLELSTAKVHRFYSENVFTTRDKVERFSK